MIKNKHKKCRFILVRHAQAEHNTRRFRVMGRALDSPLTGVGIGQAINLAQELEKEEPIIGGLYCSTAVRCQQTAKYVAQRYPSLEIILDDRLLEMDQGTFSNRFKLWTVSPKYLWRLLTKRWNYEFDQGETFLEVAQRMSASLSDISRKNPGQTVVIIGHGLAIRCLLAYCRRQSVWRLLISHLPNSARRELRFPCRTDRD